MGELVSAIAQSDGISSGGQRSQAKGNSRTIEREMSHLFRPGNAIATVEETNRPTFIRMSSRPTEINSIPPIYSVRRSFGGRSVLPGKQRSTPKDWSCKGHSFVTWFYHLDQMMISFQDRA